MARDSYRSPNERQKSSGPAERGNSFLSYAILLGVLLFATALVPDEKLFRPKLLLLELGFFLVVFFWAVHAAWVAQLRLNTSPLALVVLSWTAYVLLRAHGTDNALAAAEIRRAFLSLGAFWAASNLIGTAIDRRRLLTLWALGAGIVSAYGILQRFGGLGPIQVPQMTRVMGTFGNPIFLGVYLSISLPILWWLWRDSGTRLGQWVGGASFLLASAALFLTGTRAAWIGFGAALLVALIISTRNRKVALFLALGLAVLAVLFVFLTWSIWQRDQAHLLIWRDTLKLWGQHPLWGVGVGEFHVRFPSVAGADLISKWPPRQFIVNYVHNEFLQVAVETGFIGLILWMTCFALFVYQAVVGWKADSASFPRTEIKAVICAVTAGMTQAFFSADMRFAVTSTLVFFLIGFLPSPLHCARIITWKATRPARWGGVLGLVLLTGVVACEFSSKGPAVNMLGAFQLRPAEGWTVHYLPEGMRAGFLTRLIHPYAAQHRRSRATDFFDQQLLDPARTIADLESLAAQYPKEAAIFEKLGYAYAKEIRNPKEAGLDRVSAEKAIASFRRATELNASRPGPYNNIGNIYFTLGDQNQAMEWWNKSINADPNQVDARLNLGKVCYLNGRLKEAAAHFRKVLELNPGNDEATVYLKRMVE